MKSLLWITWNIWQDGLHAVSCPIPPKRWYIMAVVCFNLTVTNKIHHNSFICYFFGFTSDMKCDIIIRVNSFLFCTGGPGSGAEKEEKSAGCS